MTKPYAIRKCHLVEIPPFCWTVRYTPPAGSPYDEPLYEHVTHFDEALKLMRTWQLGDAKAYAHSVGVPF